MGIVRMRGPVQDTRLIMPHAGRWTLYGGAYRDGPEIVLPVMGALAEARLALKNQVATVNWAPHTLLVPESDDDEPRVMRAALYWKADGSRATPTHATSGVASRVPVVDAWTPISGWFLQPGPNVYWLSLRLSLTGAYGVPGTRFIPSPADMTYTRL